MGAAVVLGTSGWGHVGYVTSVNGDGTITISEMNRLGWNVQNYRTLSAAGYQYVLAVFCRAASARLQKPRSFSLILESSVYRL